MKCQMGKLVNKTRPNWPAQKRTGGGWSLNNCVNNAILINESTLWLPIEDLRSKKSRRPHRIIPLGSSWFSYGLSRPIYLAHNYSAILIRTQIYYLAAYLSTTCRPWPKCTAYSITNPQLLIYHTLLVNLNRRWSSSVEGGGSSILIVNCFSWTSVCAQ